MTSKTILASTYLFIALVGGVSAGQVTIVTFGDSTTAPRSTVDQVYAVRLQNLLDKDGMSANVINAGVGGSHTGRLADNGRHKRRHALDRFQEQVRDRKPHVVVVQFGWNDSWVDQGGEHAASRIPLDKYRANLWHIVATLQKDGARVILMTPNRPRTSMEAWRQERTGKYAQAVRDLAKLLKTPLVDIWAKYTQYDAADGQSLNDLLLDDVHPNDRGHQLVAKLLYEQIAAFAKAGLLLDTEKEDSQPQPRGYTIPTLDLAEQSHRQVVVDREAGQYLGHPTTVLLEDNRTMLCVYPKGHGRGAIVYKRSNDAGKTWSERLPTPKSWATSLEVPTLHRVVGPDGTKRIIMFSGLYPVRMAVTEDDGKTWSELKKVGNWGGIVTMGCVEPLRTGQGRYLAMFHDDGRFFTDPPRVQNPKVFTLYKNFSNDGGLTWSQPEATYASSDVHLCEPGLIRSPDAKQMAVLLRENARRRNSHVIFSNDEGRTWTEPRELPAALTGDRHTGKYSPDGRLFISFRDRTHESPTPGDWVAWVGTYDDIVHNREGQYRIRLMDNNKGADCAYPGVEVLPDGTFVTTTYGHWNSGEEPYIVSVRLKLEELDELAKAAD